MASRESVRSMLREATAPHHDRVDRLFSRLDLGDEGGYGRFLVAQAAAHLPVERALTLGGAADVVADWADRQRSDALRADLAELDLPEPPDAGSIRFAGPDALLGGIYVLEGSRLGGRLLKRQVPPQFPTQFLASGDPASWRTLLAILEQRLVTDEQRATATEAAVDVFRIFELAATKLTAA